MTMQKIRNFPFRAALFGLGLVAGPALADTDKLGPVSLATANCAGKMNANLMVYVCVNTTHCDYAVGVNHFSGNSSRSATRSRSMPRSGYKVFEQGQRTSEEL